MFPLIHDGDYVLFQAVAKSDTLEVGDVVLFGHIDFGHTVKIVDSVGREAVNVKGISKLSIDTQFLGAIPKSNISHRAVAIISKYKKYFSGICSISLLKSNRVKAVLNELGQLD